MKSNLIVSTVFLMGVTCASVVYAANDVKEGLWSVTVVSTISGLPGVTPPPMTNSNTACVTKDHLIPHPAKPRPGCDPEQIQTNGGTVTYQQTCNKSGVAVVTNGQITYTGDTMKGSSTTNETVHGMNITSNMNMTGHYTGPCN